MLEELKRLQQPEGEWLGRQASVLLAQAMASARSRAPQAPPFHRVSRKTSARVDRADRDALLDALLDAMDAHGK